MAKITNIPGQVYLLHFSTPLAHARHYLGWSLDAQDRIDEHLAGRGSRLVRAVVGKGIHVELVRLWEGETRNFERRLKNGGTLKRVCPLCVDEYRANRRASERSRYAAKKALALEVSMQSGGSSGG